MVIWMVVIEKLEIKINLVDKMYNEAEKKDLYIWSLLLLLLP